MWVQLLPLRGPDDNIRDEGKEMQAEDVAGGNTDVGVQDRDGFRHFLAE